MKERSKWLVRVLTMLGVAVLAACSQVEAKTDSSPRFTEKQIAKLILEYLVVIGGRGCNGVVINEGDSSRVTVATDAHCIDGEMTVAIPTIFSENGVKRQPQVLNTIRLPEFEVLIMPSMEVVNDARVRGSESPQDYYPDVAGLSWFGGEDRIGEGVVLNTSPLRVGERLVVVGIPPEQIGKYLIGQSPEPEPVAVGVTVVVDNGLCAGSMLKPDNGGAEFRPGLSGSVLVSLETAEARGLYRGHADVGFGKLGCAVGGDQLGEVIK